ncbi:MAG: L,D-transpeptidase family protein [Alphaproteobacteria bacterium]
MRIVVDPSGIVRWRGRRARCALGRGGIRGDKREGDGATPAGTFALRSVLYRADRLARPATRLPVEMIGPRDGWCDDPSHPHYNRRVRLPFTASHERLWRRDRLYNLVVVVGHNDSPPRPGLGSAIFIHVASPRYSPTAGCIALARADLLRLLGDCDRRSKILIRP